MKCDLELHPRSFTPKAIVPHQEEHEERCTRFLYLPSGARARSPRCRLYFIYARHELIIYSVFGHVATRLVVMLHPGSVS